jgi:hypothetical protein
MSKINNWQGAPLVEIVTPHFVKIHQDGSFKDLARCFQHQTYLFGFSAYKISLLKTVGRNSIILL